MPIIEVFRFKDFCDLDVGECFNAEKSNAFVQDFMAGRLLNIFFIRGLG